MNLFHLVYVSRSSCRNTEADLLQIQQVARSRNPKSDITGVLLHSRGHFIQLLEGPPANLGLLFSQITSDPRHESCDCLLFCPAKERLFPNWTMGALNLDFAGDASRTDELWHVLSQTVRTPGDRAHALLTTLQRFGSLLEEHSPAA